MADFVYLEGKARVESEFMVLGIRKSDRWVESGGACVRACVTNIKPNINTPAD